MEKEDVPAQVIEEYKKAEILRKSMAVVKKHAKKMEEIRTNPDRYEKVKGKLKTANPFAINLSSVADNTKRTIGSTATLSGRENNLNTSATKRGALSPKIKNITATSQTARAKSPRKVANFAAAGAGGERGDSEEWYKPELGDIPYAPLTKEKRAKIELRDQEIA